jgi:hypothetical protein
MNEPTMPVQVFLGTEKVVVGELLPNGNNLTLCSSDRKLQLNYEADTGQVEAKIPLEISRNGEFVGAGEVYHSGEYLCICPENQDLDLLDQDSTARLFIQPHGLMAKLDIRRGH